MKKNQLNPVELIRKKRNGGILSEDDIDYLITAYTAGFIPSYQMSALLMAIYFEGMNFQETTDLMKAMMNSGAILDLSHITKPKIDKHSTGGVGDKVSLVLAPLAAACGICVPMISGRGLGHTGGTLDKLESIPGFRTGLNMKEFITQLDSIKVAMTGQTAEIAPADRKLYALRDVTATVDSIPLIAASIMSKKLAEDLDGLVLDVKFGQGAFLPEYSRAKTLATTMHTIGTRAGIKVAAVLTDMNNPLGCYVGNSLEVIEAIETLKGNGPEDLMEITLVLVEHMLNLAGIHNGRKLAEQKLKNGDALHVLKEIVCAQGGDTLITEDYSRLPVAQYSVESTVHRNGYIHDIDTFQIGMLLVRLGGGRMQKEDTIDPSCGFYISKKIGDRVKKGDCLAKVICNDKKKADEIARQMQSVFSIKPAPKRRKHLIRETII
jgi:pyrimidine-nucleoside phosphorylase